MKLFGFIHEQSGAKNNSSVLNNTHLNGKPVFRGFSEGR